MIKAIIFDWGGVLIDRPRYKLIQYFSNYFKVSEDRFTNSNNLYISDFQKGKITEDEYWNKICEKIKVKKPKEKSLWKNGFISVYKEKKDVFNLASILKKNGYKIGFLSNTEKPSVNFFYEHKYNVFDEIVFSCNEGYRKPEDEIYKITINRLGVKPRNTIMVDDRLENIIGATNIGIKGILFNNYNQLRVELRSYAVEINNI
jgi:epoxide hydrolase-like predicted phosphatase